ncbi:MAG: hypothetical protein JWP70_1525, partial [Leifsonia sp.]|nr:hypothetical protein [Leifsonia sp.]
TKRATPEESRDGRPRRESALLVQQLLDNELGCAALPHRCFSCHLSPVELIESIGSGAAGGSPR